MAKRNVGKADYGVDPEIFVAVWEKCQTVDEVFEKLAEASKKLGRPPMPKPIIIARASNYRDAGVPLKKMRRTDARTIDTEKLKGIIAQIHGGEEPELVDGRPMARPPELPQDVRVTVNGLLTQIQDLLKQGKKKK